MYKFHLALAAVVLPMSSFAAKVSPLFELATPGAQVRALSAPITADVILTRELDEALIARLAEAGAHVERLESGRPASVGKVASVRIESGRLDEVASLAEVVRIDPQTSPFVTFPLQHTAALVGATAGWNAPAGHPGYTGEGVVIADIEEDWNILHPDLFFPDGGGFDFEDVNGDGIAGPGDRVDLDGDGVFESELSLYSIFVEDRYEGRFTGPNTHYVPATDWLFVDLDGNGTWDAGAARGFSDADPAFGEPIFLGDDLNGNGAIDKNERLLRLGTSKVRSIHLKNGKVFRRGENLSSHESTDLASAPHGTSATTVATGGWQGVNRRYVGMAPSAELVLVQYGRGARGFATILEEGVDVLMTEFSMPYGFHDGSSADEVGLTALARKGVTVVTATGNFAAVDRTARIVPKEGETSRIGFRTGTRGVPLRSAYVTITWSGGEDDVSLAVVEGDQRIEVGEGVYPLTKMALHASGDRSSRGTSMKILVFYNDGAALPIQDLTLELQATGGVGEIRLHAIDTGVWGPGSFFLDHVDEAITSISPSTADDVIGVGAFVGRRSNPDEVNGSISFYSGRGPRLDGERVVDLLAPDDPITAIWVPNRGPGYAAFGGTSGALPHAAGTAALVKQAFPHYGHLEVKKALVEAARTDDHTGEVPNDLAGFGKLDVARALFGEPPNPRSPISLRLELEGPAVPGEEVVVKAAVDGVPVEGVVVEFDVGWDGVYEVARTSTREAAFVMGSQRIPVVARAFDITGQTTRTVLWVDPCEGEECASRKDGGRGSSGGGCSSAMGGPTGLALPGLLFALGGAIRRKRR